MSSKILSATLFGLDAQIVQVETLVSRGLRQFTIVGLGDKAVQESTERVMASLKNSGFMSPRSQAQRVLVNLAPADLKKEGSAFDLPIALGYLLASGQASFNPQNKMFLGELSLQGELRRIKGALSFAILAKEQGLSEIILPRENKLEASLIDGIKVIGIESLCELIMYLHNKIKIEPAFFDSKNLLLQNSIEIDLGWIRGQEFAKRALEISAAGSHNLLMTGPPGGGKTLLAKALISILSKLSFKEAVELTKIYSAVGLLKKGENIIKKRPFRAPHHTSSEVALIGGGNPPQPGEITLAHRGILFLDEFPEFHRDVLESLRQPVEEGEITILRSKNKVSFPAKFTLVLASNPCPCGYFGSENIECKCTQSQIQKYQRKLSGPLTDRVDLFVDVPHIKYEKLIASDQNASLEIKKKVEKAREIQRERFLNSRDKGNQGKLTNSEMEIQEIKKHCKIDSLSHQILKKYVDSGKLSARGYHRVLKVARTIADLEGGKEISSDNVAEALMYRLREEKR